MTEDNNNNNFCQFNLTAQLLTTKPQDMGFTSKARGNHANIVRVFSTFLSRTDNSVDSKEYFTCFPSIDLLSELTAVNRNNVIQVLTYLEWSGVITSQRRFNNSKLYTWFGFKDGVLHSMEDWISMGKPKPQAQDKPLKKVQKEDKPFINAKPDDFDDWDDHIPGCDEDYYGLEPDQTVYKTHEPLTDDSKKIPINDQATFNRIYNNVCNGNVDVLNAKYTYLVEFLENYDPWDVPF
ncbi:hypothetical protein [Photobacterium damselae]|uniref:hypothetical protein n=1 Tax=Photobacterium damselae TaxID=38293 RepID=UPI00406820B4